MSERREINSAELHTGVIFSVIRHQGGSHEIEIEDKKGTHSLAGLDVADLREISDTIELRLMLEQQYGTPKQVERQ